MLWLLVYSGKPFILAAWKIEVHFINLRLKCLAEAFYLDYVSGQRTGEKIWTNSFCPEVF